MMGLMTALAVSAAGPFAAAAWIAPPEGLIRPFETPRFRKTFSLDGAPRRASLRIIGLGDWSVTVNGRGVTPTGINQPWSQYEKTLYWTELDIRRFLQGGENCIGVELGASFWSNPNPPAGRYNKDGPQRSVGEPYLLCAEIEMETPDGATVRVGTDATWRVHRGPVTFSHLFAGEDYDARLETAGWDRAAYDAGGWATARVVEAPNGDLKRRDWPGFASFDRYAPTEIRADSEGRILVAFPQNISAQLRMELSGGTPGADVRVRCGEHRAPDGRVAGAYAVDCHIVTDGRRVRRRWHSFYLGMQFAEVTGAVLPGASNPDRLPVLKKLELIHVRDGLATAGRFRSSSDLYNRTLALVDAAVRSNMSWVMTDCPHREKLGWLECAYLLAPTFLYGYEGRAWFAKIAGDIRDAQTPEGMIRTVAPSYPAGKFPGAFDWTVEWGAAGVMVPWIHYEWFGDAGILRDNFDCMRRFTDYVGSLAADGLAPEGLGDWYDYGHGHGPGPSRFTPTNLSSTATWALCALTVSRAARVLGLADLEARYGALHEQIGEAFRRRFQDPTTRLLRHLGSPQCANAMAICAEVVPEADYPVLIEDIIADLVRRGYQQTPGDVGHVYFIRALAQAGRSDVLHRVYSRTGTGSYGGILAKGLTSMPETWDAMMDGYQSLNHCMLGHVVEWFYAYVGGIRQSPGGTGWTSVVIGPNPGDLSSCDAEVRTPRGRIRSSWRMERGTMVLEVTIPRGVRAEALLPSGKRVALRAGRSVVHDD